MQPALSTTSAPPPVPRIGQLSGNLRQGFTTKKQSWNPGPNVVNSTTQIGLQASLFLEGLGSSHSARYYNPQTGRFLSRDPWDGDIHTPSTLNKYSYSGSDPIDSSDPSGRTTIENTITIGNISLSPRVVNAVGALGAAIACAYIWDASKSEAAFEAGPTGTIRKSAVPCIWVAAKGANRPPEPWAYPGQWPYPVPAPWPVPGTSPSPKPPECKELRDKVNKAKDEVGKWGACAEGMTRWQLQVRYDAWLTLALARGAEDKVCFNGGNWDHQDQEQIAWQHVTDCSDLLLELP